MYPNRIPQQHFQGGQGTCQENSKEPPGSDTGAKRLRKATGRRSQQFIFESPDTKRANQKCCPRVYKNYNFCRFRLFGQKWSFGKSKNAKRVKNHKKTHPHFDHMLDQSGSKRVSQKEVPKACPKTAFPGTRMALPKELKIDPRAPKAPPRDAPGSFPKRVPKK